MKYQAVFKRYEMKYLITREQKQAILGAMAPYMKLDEYGKSTIRNIYLDTDDYILARHSTAKPDYKEKIRIRSYGKAAADSEVFVELKRKCDHIVYKRRIALPESDAMKWVAGAGNAAIEQECKAVSAQVTEEIEYFCSLYPGLRPTVYLSYDREAYRMKDGSDFRVTFDSNIRSRDYDISLESDVYGTALMDEDKVLMELKCSGGIPLWMAEVLSAGRIYKTSFSKYGTAYQNILFPAAFTNSVTQTDKAASDAAEAEAVDAAATGTVAAAKSGSVAGRASQKGKTKKTIKQKRHMFTFGRQQATA